MIGNKLRSASNVLKHLLLALKLLQMTSSEFFSFHDFIQSVILHKLYILVDLITSSEVKKTPAHDVIEFSSFT